MMDVEHRSKDSSLLPSQFFAEENDGFPVNNKHCHGNWRAYSGSSDFGSSSLSSTAESELGYMESDHESDEDDEYIAQLTRQMAHFMFEDDDDFEHGKGETPICSKSQQQAQEKSGKLETNKETQEYKSSHKVLSTSASVPVTEQNPSSHSVYFQSKQALIDEQIRAVQALQHSYPRKKQKQQKSLSRKKQQNRYSQMEHRGQVRQVQDKGIPSCIGFAPAPEVSTVHLQDQQKPGSDKEAVCLGETCSKTGSCGTGVFLPRASVQSSKKTGCPTVIIPARVAQALKLHFDRMGPTSKSNGAGFPLQQDASTTGNVSYLLQSQPKSRSRKASALKHQQEMSLPQEWTY